MPTSAARRRPAGRLLWRGLRRKCPRCGGGRVFETWFRMKRCCPTCDLEFERGESDFFLGAYVINLAIAEGLLMLLLLGYILRKAGDHSVPSTPVVLIGAVVFALGAPVLFYPFSRTIWTAIDLIMRPVPRDEDTPKG